MADLKLTVDTSDVVKGIQSAERFQRQINKLDKAFKAGTITQSQYQRGINQQVSAMTKLGGAYRDNQSQVSRYAAELRRAATAQDMMSSGIARSQKASRQFELGIQQAGYQVGDFFVQVQSGTNALTAFSQQGTQLVSFFGGPYGAAIGGALAITTAIGAAFLRTGGSAEDFKDTLDSVSDSIDAFIDNSRNMTESVDFMLERYGSATRELLELEAQLQQIRLQEVLLSAAEAAQTLSSSMSGFRSSAANLESLFGLDALGNITNTEQTVRRLADTLRRIGTEDSFGGQLSAARELAAEILRITGGVEKMNLEQLGFYNNIVSTISELTRAKQVQDGFLGSVTDTKSEAELLSATIAGLNFSAAIAGSATLADNLAIAAENSRNILYGMDTRTIPGAEQNMTVGTGLSTIDIEGDLLDDYMFPVNSLSTRESIKESRKAARKASKKKGSGGSKSDDSIGGLARSLLSEREEIKAWREESLRDLKEFNERELKILGGKNAAKLRIEEEYRSKLLELQAEQFGDFMPEVQRAADLARLAEWKEDSLSLLQEFNERELEMLGGQEEAKLRIQEEYQKRVDDLRKAERAATLDGYQSMFGNLASLMQTENQKLFKIGQAAAIAEATVSGYRSAVEAWEWGMSTGGPPLAAAATAASLAKTGALIANIASQSPNGGSSGGGGGGSGGGGGEIATPAASQAPQKVFIEGLRPNDMISGEMLQDLFDRFYDENEERGAVFMVRR